MASSPLTWKYKAVACNKAQFIDTVIAKLTWSSCSSVVGCTREITVLTDTKSLMWKYLDEFAVNHSMHDKGFIPLMLKNVGRLSKFQPPNAFWPSRTPHYGLNDYKTSSNQLDNALNLPQISMQKESRMVPDIIFFCEKRACFVL